MEMQIYGFFPYQIKHKFKRAPDPIKIKKNREPFDQSKDCNIL